ncbi:hypothetical protein Poly51_60750 [Rubripirellula tenax]|uniref:Uncharacterized protein n=1 Tax=Rubripirellula tenax TaxID=2528015 RepID=A0A5C6EBE4_9BACT|nr:hypothetical protein [Rubripirellula tenax]TWU44509.1 hypothetical protein Poly51_60750 [Rubripirellula tenax]
MSIAPETSTLKESLKAKHGVLHLIAKMGPTWFVLAVMVGGWLAIHEINTGDRLVDVDEAAWRDPVQWVPNQCDSFCVYIASVTDEPLNVARPVDRLFGRTDMNLAPSAKRFNERERVAHPSANLFEVSLFTTSPPHRQRRPRVRNQMIVNSKPKRSIRFLKKIAFRNAIESRAARSKLRGISPPSTSGRASEPDGGHRTQ